MIDWGEKKHRHLLSEVLWLEIEAIKFTVSTFELFKHKIGVFHSDLKFQNLQRWSRSCIKDKNYSFLHSLFSVDFSQPVTKYLLFSAFLYFCFYVNKSVLCRAYETHWSADQMRSRSQLQEKIQEDLSLGWYGAGFQDNLSSNKQEIRKTFKYREEGEY